MKVSDREIELAEARVEQERDAGVARIRALLSAEGDEDCMDCARPIGAARRMALPSAVRCVECQERHERKNGVRGRI